MGCAPKPYSEAECFSPTPAGDAWIVTCPFCGFKGGDVTDFDISLCDECFCPKCNERFEMDDPEDEDDDA